jgi:branched-chain amino acid transport system permease protein
MSYIFSIAILTGIYIILSASLNLIVGYGGIFDMGHGGFFAVGAYIAALITVHYGMPFFLELIIAGAVAGVMGLAIGLPSIRLRGDYITLCSYGFAVVVYTIVNNWMSLTHGPVGISGVTRPHILGISFYSQPAYLCLVAFICAICLFAIKRITQAPYGKTIEAIREDEIATLACGKNVSSFKVQIFVVGAFFAGVAGVLYAHFMMLADPTGFKVATSSLILTMVIMGGLASLRGSVAGAVIIIVVPEILRMIGLSAFYAEQIQNIIYSALLLVVIKLRPGGLFGKLKM